MPTQRGRNQIPTLISQGWAQEGPRTYVHRSGARIVGIGQLWTAIDTNEVQSTGHSSVMNACKWVEKHDPTVWSFHRGASFGILGGVFYRAGYLDLGGREHAVVCSVLEGNLFPREAVTPFKRAFLGKARCARCGNLQSELVLSKLGSGTVKGEGKLYVVCDCGHPVWKISPTDYYEAGRAMTRPEYTRVRKERLARGGAKHTRAELREILAGQKNRCLYCGRKFEEELRPTVDHLLPASKGGADWALNIVMACWRCNSDRSAISFRSYCRSLGLARETPIMKHLAKRIATTNPATVHSAALACLARALELTPA
jgi:hypothetical protein